MTPIATETELADFLRDQAGKCLQLARQMANHAIAVELIVIAARFHDHATNLERSAKSRSPVDAAS